MLAAMTLSAQPLPYPDRTPPGPPCTDCPNIIFSLTDDQDLTLGGWDPMRQTQAAIQSAGATLSRWTIHTPICSPSRSETISGRYFHNIKSDVAVPPPVVMPAATGHVNGSLYDNQSVAYLLRSRKGFQVGMFGKSNFNTYQGFDRWFQGAALGYGNTWEDDEGADGHYHANKSEYATALLSNKTVEWLMRPGVGVGPRPWFAYFAPHCPHSPATPAHWYADACPHTAAPRQPLATCRCRCERSKTAVTEPKRTSFRRLRARLLGLIGHVAGIEGRRMPPPACACCAAYCSWTYLSFLSSSHGFLPRSLQGQ